MSDIRFYDTSSLLIAGEAIFERKEPFVISSITLKELENIKTSNSKDAETKYSARLLLRLLEENKNMYEVYIHTLLEEAKIAQKAFAITDDLRILSDAIAYDNNCRPDETIFVTNDLCLAEIANLYFGEDCIEKIEEDKDYYTGYLEIQPSEEELADFYQHLNINKYNLLKGQYIIIFNQEGQVIDKRVWDGDMYAPLHFKPFKSEWFGIVKPYAGDPYQQLLCDSLINNRITLVKGPAGTGKAQPVSTKIPTPDGFKQLGDLKPGDMVYDRLGKKTKILQIYPQGILDNYKVTFSDGRIAYCNNEHLWTCYTSKGNLKTFNLQEMIDKGFVDNSTKTGYRFKVPVNKAVNYPTRNYPIDPYVIGVFLGDGCCKEVALTLSSEDEEIVKEVSNLIGAFDYYRATDKNYSWLFSFQEREGKGKRCNLLTKNVFKGLESYIIQPCQSKSIPPEYKIGDINQRKALLQGLLDTDGSIDKRKGRIRFTSTSLKLIQDVQEICWSLGYLAKISKDCRNEKYTNNICYTLTISCSRAEKIDLFRLKRKKEIAEYVKNNLLTKEKNNDRIAIISAEKVGQEEMKCILVDNDEHLYLTNQYIVTHNTLLSFAYLMYAMDKGIIDKIVVFCNTVATANSAKLGFYPGTRDEKLLDSQIGNLLSSKFGGREGVEKLIEDNKLILLPLSDIRGYDTSGMNAGVYISEAQNLDRTLIKLALQRIGEDCICIIDGDEKTQVDDIHFSGNNNGIKRVSKVFRGQDIYGEVTLKNIYRSKISKIAENI